MRQIPLGVRLRSAAVFENFHAGQNLEAIGAVRTATDPVWICGPAAAGKTHLLQAVCAASSQPCAYVDLLGEPGMPPAVLEGLDKLRLLSLDNVERAAGEAGWERALFHLFNAVADHRTRLILAASTVPTAIHWRLPDWASRAASCQVFQLRMLDDVERIEALRLRARTRGLTLPHETAQYLLRRMPRDQQTLFDLVDRLDEESLVAQRPLTVPFVRQALKL